ncbi:MAG: helix-turn-helix transcriptional regulator [Defluviimonas denitrificans]
MPETLCKTYPAKAAKQGGRKWRSKLYAGSNCAETRTRLGLTQKYVAAKLGVSLPYLNQMENHRPVSAAVVLALRRVNSALM